MEPSWRIPRRYANIDVLKNGQWQEATRCKADKTSLHLEEVILISIAIEIISFRYIASLNFTMEDHCINAAVQDLKIELNEKYQSLSRIRPMPWIPQQEFSLTNVYTELVLQESRTMAMLTSGQQLRNLFAAHEHSSDPKRILIEGEAGIGKTTLLQMLVSKWNEGSCGGECGSSCVHCFDLLFNLHAKDFIGHTSIPDVIKSCLLARDSEISIETLKAILQKHKVVLVVDAYDEGCMENHLLNDVIEGRVLKDATLLLSSRPAFLKCRLFDSIFFVHGFDKVQQIEYADRLAHERNLSPESMGELKQKMSNELQDLCRNPFIVTILCMLCSETSPHLPSTRTGVFKAVHEFFIEKASRKNGRGKDDIKRSIISPLAKLSLEIYNRRQYLTEEDFEDLGCSPEEACQIGYLYQDETVGSTQNATRCYRFGHQTLQDFLAAIHLTKMATNDRLEWLQSKNVNQIDTIVIFLFGQLNDEELASTVAANNMRFDPLNFSKLLYYSCSQSHLFLHCLNELAGRESISDRLKNVLVKNCPFRVRISRSCSLSCFEGVSMICSLITKKHSVSLIFDLNPTRDLVTLFEKLESCKCISLVQLNYPTDWVKFNDCLRALQVGRTTLSCVRSLSIGHPDIGEGAPELNIGQHMHTMKLLDCESVSFSRRFLEAVMAQKCSTFEGLLGVHLPDCTLDSECFAMLLEILKKFHQHIRYLNISNVNTERNFRIAGLLSDIAGLKNLCFLEISLEELNFEEKNSFKQILQKNTLDKLHLLKCDFSEELHKALSDCFSRKSNLKNISFIHHQDSAVFRQTLSAVSHLRDLKSISIERTPLSDETLEMLTSVLLKLNRLTWMTLDRIGSDHHSERLQNLFKAIASCKSITGLTLAGMPIDDVLVSFLCEMVKSLEYLQDLTLWKNELSANALEDLSEALEHRANKLNILDIKDNEGSENGRVVELLQRTCRSVIHD
ncbi:hypothetical protein CAPTEDRAFT_213366 [Capitella teleta]|uniref:NACHT domain-containing protein n=1 Tax=Capitella teleta TaxID=283909 RepID=R7U0W4_CAPTE|nr:hypothetical protein CAPTEDRAFT_213366 [Capitella teleta]|eukprot:ELT99654.1 hypothetical protein CAPTEDRAFT_213366 [Capitella teleta]